VTTSRSVAVDALRGFALFGIILVNTPFFSQPLWAEPAITGVADLLALWFTHAFATGKFFLIFSFLFGFGFASMLARAEDDGLSPRGRILRRFLGLFVFGALHAVFLFFGDILMLYALLGLPLWLCRAWPARRLLALSGVLMSAAILCQTAALLAALDAGRQPPPPGPGAGYLGGFLDGAAQRVAELPETFAFGLPFNGPAAMAMFFAGLALSRMGAMPPDPAALRRPARIALAIGGIGSGTLMALALATDPDSPSEAAAWVGTAAFCALAPVLSFGMAGTVLDLAQRYRESHVVRLLATAGGATLTGYILHSVLLGAVFNGWGLGLYGTLGPAACLGIGVLAFLAVAIAIGLWRRHFRYGPEEWLLRSFVELQWKRMRLSDA